MGSQTESPAPSAALEPATFQDETADGGPQGTAEVMTTFGPIQAKTRKGAPGMLRSNDVHAEASQLLAT